MKRKKTVQKKEDTLEDRGETKVSNNLFSPNNLKKFLLFLVLSVSWIGINIYRSKDCREGITERSCEFLLLADLRINFGLESVFNLIYPCLIVFILLFIWYKFIRRRIGKIGKDAKDKNQLSRLGFYNQEKVYMMDPRLTPVIKKIKDQQKEFDNQMSKILTNEQVYNQYRQLSKRLSKIEGNYQKILDYLTLIDKKLDKEVKE